MDKITRYIEFINENLILEANIKFEKSFLELIDGIDSPIKSAIIELVGTEVDVNQNYLDIILDKEDTVSFLQDDRVERLKYSFDYSDYSTYNRIHHLYDLPEFSITKSSLDDVNRELNRVDRKVDIVRFLSVDDPGYEYFSSILRSYNAGIAKFEVNGKDVYLFVYSIHKDTSTMKRGEIKIGRFVRALLKKAKVDISEKDIEDFVTKYKSMIKIKNDSFSRFEIVNKEDIRMWYLDSNYESSAGTLGGSCMRYSKCQDFLNIYTENPDKVSMVILRSDKHDDKISGRAILWTSDDDKKIMDRIYTNDHADIDLFINYANKCNYHYKYAQNYEPMPLMFNGIKLSNEESSIVITLSTDFRQFPYMDTFKYKSDGMLTNDYGKSYDTELTDTDGGDGGCDACGGSGRCSCEECDGDGDRSCDECYNGSVSCSDCDSNGTVDCDNCDGNGTIDCGECDGNGCDACEGSGTIDCDASGCDGDGTIECVECRGEGEYECGECSGEGRVSCGCCDGDGYNNCYECN